MAWVLLLIQLLPTILKLIDLIRDLIQHDLPRAEKAPAWAELKQICRQNLRKKRGLRAYGLRTSESTVVAELEALHEKLKLKVVA